MVDVVVFLLILTAGALEVVGFMWMFAHFGLIGVLLAVSAHVAFAVASALFFRGAIRLSDWP